MITLNFDKKLTFDSRNHIYYYNGEQIRTGLTALLRKYNLSKSLANVKEEILQEAQERGTQVHAEIEMFDKYGIEPQHEWAKPYTQAGFNVLASEYLVNYKTLLATAIDKVIDNGDDTVTIADIKTTSSIDIESVTWQCNMGAYLFYQMNPTIAVTKCVCIWLRDGKIKVVELKAIAPEDMQALLDAEEQNNLDFVPKRQTEDYLPEALTLQAVEVKKALSKIKDLEKLVQMFKDEVLNFMLSNKIEKMQSPDGELKLTLVKEHKTTRFDSKTALKDDPTLAKYIKASPVKASIKIY